MIYFVTVIMMMAQTWRPGMMVKAPRPNAITSVIEVTVTEMPACRMVWPIWRGDHKITII